MGVLEAVLQLEGAAFGSAAPPRRSRSVGVVAEPELGAGARGRATSFKITGFG